MTAGVVQESAPWHVQMAKPARVPVVYDSLNHAVAVIGGTRPSGGHVERQEHREALAYAISALPDLLALAHATADYFADKGGPLGAAARVAIAKAERRQP